MMLRALLFTPWTFFERRAEDLRLGGGAVLFAGVWVALLVVLAGALWVLTDQMTGTVTVDNPDRPPEWACGGSFEEMTVTPSGCGEPATVTRHVGDLLWQEVSGILPVLFVVGLALSVVIAGALHVGALIAGGDGRFGATFEVAAWGMVPTLLTGTVGATLLIAFALTTDLSMGNPDQVVAQLRQLQGGAFGLGATVLGLVGAVWQAYVWAGGLLAVHDLERVAAGAVAALVSLGLFLLG